MAEALLDSVCTPFKAVTQSPYLAQGRERDQHATRWLPRGPHTTSSLGDRDPKSVLLPRAPPCRSSLQPRAFYRVGQEALYLVIGKPGRHSPRLAA